MTLVPVSPDEALSGRLGLLLWPLFPPLLVLTTGVALGSGGMIVLEGVGVPDGVANAWIEDLATELSMEIVLAVGGVVPRK